MTLRVINPLEYPHWDDVLFNLDAATFFHTSAWARVLVESYGYQPLYFTIFENGKLSSLIPVMEVRSFFTRKRGASLPFTDACDPLAGSPDTFNGLLKNVTTYGRQAGWKHFEIRGASKFLPNEPVFAEHFVHRLELAPGEENVSRNFKSNTRRNIQKAEREGVAVTFDCSQEAVAAFYKLHCSTRKHHGLPPQPWVFFRKIHEHVLSAGKGFVALAIYQKRCIAGALYALYRDQAIYKYGASDRSLQHLRANNLVMFEAIRWCCRNGIGSFSFGRTEPDNEGLLRFKRGWGAAEEQVRYYRYDIDRKEFAARKTGPKTSYEVFKILPIPMLRWAGNLLYRYVG